MKKESQASQIVRMILDSVDHSNKGQLGLLGQIMIKHAAKVEEKMYGDEDRELIDKMRKLKRAEDKGDLFWIDYKSWNILSPDLKKHFEEALDPLYWNGVFTTYTEFCSVETRVLSRLHSGIIANLIQHGKVYQFFVVACDAREYHMMSMRDFEKLQQTIFANLLRAYCRVNNDIVVKEFNYKKKQQQGTSSGNKQENHPTAASM